MTFAQRQINLQFSGSDGIVTLPGLRCIAMITNPGGFNAFGQLQLRVWGMTMAHMNQFSSTGSNMVTAQNLSITLTAGNVGGVISQVFSGTLIRSFIDMSSPPDACFTCAAISGYFEKSIAAAANSWPGTNNAEQIIAALAQSIGFGFSNPSSAHAVVRDQYTCGSAIDQIMTVAKAAAIPIKIENNTVYVWPNNGTLDDVTIDLGPGNGLVGYPTYWESGFIVKSEFNPMIANGRTINLTSSIPQANGSWPTQNVIHELSTLTPDGPWFTTARLSPSAYVSTN